MCAGNCPRGCKTGTYLVGCRAKLALQYTALRHQGLQIVLRFHADRSSHTRRLQHVVAGKLGGATVLRCRQRDPAAARAAPIRQQGSAACARVSNVEIHAWVSNQRQPQQAMGQQPWDQAANHDCSAGSRIQVMILVYSWGPFSMLVARSGLKITHLKQTHQSDMSRHAPAELAH